MSQFRVRLSNSKRSQKCAYPRSMKPITLECRTADTQKRGAPPGSSKHKARGGKDPMPHSQ
eukprot:5367281-Amphidinium_carterae.1